MLGAQPGEPLQLGRAAQRTIYRDVLDTYLGNPLMDYDATALFAVAHGNTATSALSQSAVSAVRTKMLKQVGLSAVDARGDLLDSVKQVLDIIAEHDAVLSCGHLHISEVWPLFSGTSTRSDASSTSLGAGVAGFGAAGAGLAATRGGAGGAVAFALVALVGFATFWHATHDAAVIGNARTSGEMKGALLLYLIVSYLLNVEHIRIAPARGQDQDALLVHATGRHRC